MLDPFIEKGILDFIIKTVKTEVTKVIVEQKISSTISQELRMRCLELANSCPNIRGSNDVLTYAAKFEDYILNGKKVEAKNE